MNDINIKFDELNKLRIIGSGTDGITYKYKDDLLLKIYRSKLNEIKNANQNMNGKTKIYNREKLVINNFEDNINYYRNNYGEDIRIRTSEAIEKAIQKQLNVKRTNLPLSSVYVDNKFAGCLLKKSNGIQIHKFINFPHNIKRTIILNSLKDIKELLENNIYHIDLSNSPYCPTHYFDENNKLIIEKGHSHILVNPISLKTDIIDLDGKSTIYTEKFNYNLKKKTIFNLCVLLIEFLYKIDMSDIEENDEVYFELIKNGVNYKFAKKLSNNSFNNIDEIKKYLIKH